MSGTFNIVLFSFKLVGNTEWALSSPTHKIGSDVVVLLEMCASASLVEKRLICAATVLLFVVEFQWLGISMEVEDLYPPLSKKLPITCVL